MTESNYGVWNEETSVKIIRVNYTLQRPPSQSRRNPAIVIIIIIFIIIIVSINIIQFALCASITAASNCGFRSRYRYSETELGTTGTTDPSATGLPAISSETVCSGTTFTGTFIDPPSCFWVHTWVDCTTHLAPQYARGHMICGLNIHIYNGGNDRLHTRAAAGVRRILHDLRLSCKKAKNQDFS